MDKYLIKLNRKETTSCNLTTDCAEAPALYGPSTSSNIPSTSGTASKRKSKTVYEAKRKRGFVYNWKQEYPWLVNDEVNSIMYCEWCRTYPELADMSSPLFIGTGPGAAKPTEYRKGGITTHDSSVHHKRAEGKQMTSENPGKAPIDVFLKTISDTEKKRMESLINTAHFMAKEDIAMAKFSELCDLQEKNGLDLGINYRNNRACRQFVDAIAITTKQKLADEIKEARFLCVMGDGTTDRGVIEQESVYVRYVGRDGSVKSKMVDCCDVESGDASGVLKGLDIGLESVGVSETVQKEKLIACNFDGAAVNMGQKNGVAKRLKDRIGNHLITVHCVAHNLELSVLDVMNDNDMNYLDNLESTLRGVYKFYHMSPKQRRGLHELASVLNEDMPYYSGVKQVRWLASRWRAICAVEKNYRVTVEHLENVAANEENLSATATGLLRKLKTVSFVKFLYFMIDFMRIFATLSQRLQHDKLIVTDVTHDIEEATLKLLELKECPGEGETKLLQNLDPDTNVMQHGKGSIVLTIGRGAGAADNMNNLKNNIIDKAVSYIDKRFVAFYSPPLKHFKVFDIREWPQEREQLASYGKNDISALVEIFKCVLSDEECNAIKAEWTSVKSRLTSKANNVQSGTDVVDVFSNILLINPPNLKNIITLIKLMLTISVSTAVVERGFSSLNRIKTSLRSTMTQECLKNHLMVSINTPSVRNFEATEDVLNTWMESGKGTRHIHGHKIPACKMPLP